MRSVDGRSVRSADGTSCWRGPLSRADRPAVPGDGDDDDDGDGPHGGSRLARVNDVPPQFRFARLESDPGTEPYGG